jgi:SSS family solute:Na+ symporter
MLKMGTMFWVLIIVLYAVVMIGIGWVLKKQGGSSFANFSLGNSRFGGVAITLMSVGAMIGGGGLIGLSSWCSEGGLMEFWTYSMAYLGMLPWIFLFVRRIRVLHVYTAPDILALRFRGGKELIKYPAAIFYAIRGATLLAMQLNALAFLFTTFFGWPHALGVVVSTLIVVLYTITSGYLSVAFTNMIQSIFQTVTPFLALGLVLTAVQGFSKVQEHYAAQGEAGKAQLFGGLGSDFIVYFIVDFLTVGLFYFIGDQFDYQRVNASKDSRSARNGILLGVLIAVPCLLVPSYIGISAAVYLPEGFTPTLLFYEIIKSVHPALAAVLLVGVLSTIMSATSSYMFGSAMNISHDILTHHIKRTGVRLSDEQRVKFTRIGVIISAVIGIGFAILIPNIISVWLAGLAICTGGLFVPFMGAWFSKQINTAAAISCMFTGGIVSFVWWTILGNPFGIHGIWVGIGISLLTAIVARLFTKAPSPEEIEATYYFGEKFNPGTVQKEENCSI